jgi:hypothetical protein
MPNAQSKRAAIRAMRSDRGAFIANLRRQREAFV